MYYCAPDSTVGARQASLRSIARHNERPNYYYSEQDLEDERIQRFLDNEMAVQQLRIQAESHILSRAPTAASASDGSAVKTDAGFPTPDKSEHSTADGQASHDSTATDKHDRHSSQDYARAKLQHQSSTSAQINLDGIQDEQVRDALNAHSTVSMTELSQWDEAKLDALVDSFSPEFLPGMLRKSQIYEKGKAAKSLSWHQIVCNESGVKDNDAQEAERLLNCVSGHLHAGEICAILGGPDSGATPLLDILAGREKKFTGEVLYGGEAPGADLTRDVSLVVKDDVHIALLTVYETLWFSARLRMPPSVPDRLVRLRVKIVLKLLGLSHVQDSIVGDAFVRGISGGEKRRVSFGVEMVAGRECLLASLPTNGLDSATAYSLIRTMRYISKAGNSMMCSIVQPAPELYRLFHKILLLSKGAVLYFGPPDHAQHFIDEAGFRRPQSKSLPAFLEELSAAPERFYVHRFTKELTLHREDAHAEPEAIQVRVDQRIPHVESEERRDDGAPTHSESTSALATSPAAGEIELMTQKEALAISPSEAAKKSQQPPSSHAHAAGLSAHKSAPAWDDSTEIARPKVANHRTQCWNLLVDRYEGSVFKRRVHSDWNQAKHSNTNNKEDTKRASHSTPEAGSTASSAQSQDVHNKKQFLATSSAHTFSSRYNAPYSLQFYENLLRMSKVFFRNVGLWRNAWLRAIFIGFLIGSLFYNLSANMTDVRNRVGLIFFLALYIGFGGISLLPIIIAQRPVYYAQNTSNYYHGFAYYFSLQLVQIPILIVEITLLLTPVWGLSNLSGGDWQAEFWFAWLILFVTALISRAWVMLLLAISPIEAMAQVLLTMTNLLFIILCGFLIPSSFIENGWYWFHVISYFTYIFRSLVINDVHPLYNDCIIGSPSCPYQTGDAALMAQYSIDGSYDKWKDFARLIGVMIAFNFGAAMAYSYINWDRADSPEVPEWLEDDTEVKKRQGLLPSGRSSRRRVPLDRVKSKIVRDETMKSGSNPDSKALAIAPMRQQDESIPQPIPEAALRVVKAQKSSSSPALLENESTQAAAASSDAPKSGNINALVSVAPHAPVQRANSFDYGFEIESRQTDSLVGNAKAYMQWKDLSFTVTLENGTQRRLLNKCFGFVSPGRMRALMGASGAGKSTLLDVLANRKTGGLIEGEMLINGRPRDAAFSRIMGYVEQADSHNPFSTVREAIAFSGKMRLPQSVTDSELALKVKNVLEVLGITHLGDSLIGAPGFGGVAPEVRKKVTIGVELIAEPSLLFLDEPTTGLDSAGAFAVMSAIHTLSKRMAVICTVHQPSTELTRMFDDIILMKDGGEVVYCGAMNDLVTYFASHKLGRCPDDKNPVDFALDQLKRCNEIAKHGERFRKEEKQRKHSERNQSFVSKLKKRLGSSKNIIGSSHAANSSANASSADSSSPKPASPREATQVQDKQHSSQFDDVEKQTPDSQDRILQNSAAVQQEGSFDKNSKHGELEEDGGFEQLTPELCSRLPALFLESNNYKATEAVLKDGIMPEEERKAYHPPDLASTHANFFTQLVWLTARFFHNMHRNLFGLVIRYFLILVFVVFMGLIFLRLQYGQQDASERLGAIFLTLINVMFSTSAFLPEIFAARAIYFRERGSQMYSSFAYFLARYAGDAPYVALEVILYSLIFFFVDVNSYNHNVAYGWFLWVLLALRYTGIFLVHFFATAFAAPDDAATLQITFYNVQLAFSGFLIAGPSIPSWWVWLYDISFIRYALSTMTYFVFIHEQYVCDPSQFIAVYSPYTGSCDLNASNSDLTVTPSPDGSGNVIHKCATACGSDLLDQFGISTSTNMVIQNFAILHCFALFFFICAYLALRFINHVKR